MSRQPNVEYAESAASILAALMQRSLSPEQSASMAKARALANREHAERDRRVRAAMREAQRQANERIAEEMIARVLPPKLAEEIKRAQPEEPAMFMALKWWRNNSSARGILLRGGVGAGKSVAAAAVVAEAIRCGKRSVSWHTPDDFTSAVLHAYDDDAPRIGGDLVVIDEFGDERKADFPQALRRFVDSCSCSTRFVLTSNLTPDTLRARYDVRLLDRLEGEVNIFDVPGESLRRKVSRF